VVSLLQPEFSYCGALHGSAHQQWPDGEGGKHDRPLQNHAKGGGAKVHEGSEKSKSFEVNIISVIQRNVHDLLITREEENDSRI